MEGLLGPTGARLEKIVGTQRRNENVNVMGVFLFFPTKTILILCLSCVTTGSKKFLAANCFPFCQRALVVVSSFPPQFLFPISLLDPPLSSLSYKALSSLSHSSIVSPHDLYE